MNTENNRIAKNTIFLYIRTIVVMMISLYTSRIVLQSLGVEDYGIYNVVGGLISVISFVNGAMSASTIRYITFELGKKDLNKLNAVFNTSLQIHFAISVVVFVLSETLGLWFMYNKMTIPYDRIDAASVVFHVSVFTCMLGILNVPYNSLLIAHERMSHFAYISVCDAVLKLMAAISVTYFLYDRLVVYAIMMLVIYFSIICVYQLYCRHYFPESHFRIIGDRSLINDMSKYAFWCLFSNLAYVTYTQGVNVLLNVFFGPVVNAARGISEQVQSAISRFVQSFQSAINPQIIKTYANDDKERLLFLIQASSRYSFYLILMMIFPLMVEIDQILRIWLVEVPDHTVNFLRIFLLTMPVGVMLNPLNMATQATGKIKRFALITGSIQLLIFPLSYLVLRLGGAPESVYVVYLVVTYLNMFLYIYLTCYEIKISMWNYIKEVVFRVFGVAIIGAIVPLLFNHYCDTSTAIIYSISNMILAELSIILSIFFVGMGAGEKKLALSYLKTKVLK